MAADAFVDNERTFCNDMADPFAERQKEARLANGDSYGHSIYHYGLCFNDLQNRIINDSAGLSTPELTILPARLPDREFFHFKKVLTFFTKLIYCFIQDRMNQVTGNFGKG
jgi:hypothetical protein